MDNVTINVFNTVGNSFCVEAADGQKVFEMIAKAFREHKSVLLSFQNVEMLTSAFLNTAVGQLYRDFKEDEIKKGISVDGMASDDMALLKRVTDTAKLFYKDPNRMEMSINEILGE